jgi:hypothetical protein
MTPVQNMLTQGTQRAIPMHRLPAVNSVQVNIFSELRQREEEHAYRFESQSRPLRDRVIHCLFAWSRIVTKPQRQLTH